MRVVAWACLCFSLGCGQSALSPQSDLALPSDLSTGDLQPPPSVHLDLSKWVIGRGVDPDDYEGGIDSTQTYMGMPVAYLKSTQHVTQLFGTLLSVMPAGEFAGHRVRLSAWMKSDSVSQWGGMWIRVDAVGDGGVLSFDNMMDRPLSGTSDWMQYSDVVDVPDGAAEIFLGLLLVTDGEIWISDAKLEAVDDSVPTTGGF
jgi:hypothetical protein